MPTAAELVVSVKAAGITATSSQIRSLHSDLTKASGAASTTGRSMDAMGKKGQRSFSIMKGAASAFAGVAVFNLAKKGISAVVAEYEEAQKVGAQTNAVIKSTGRSANVSAKQVSALAESISTKVGIDDEAIQSGENLLLTFKNIQNQAGKGNDIFNQTTQVMTDMSVAMDQDMKSSAIQLGKALNDPIKGITALTRVGVTFTEQQKEQIAALVESGDTMKAQKIILAELNSEFGGSAAAQATGFDKLKVALNNIAEDVGNKVLPVFGDLADSVSKVLSDDKLSATKKFDKLLELGEGFAGKMLDGLQKAAPQIAAFGARMAMKVAESFVSAFNRADILGKLFVAGSFIRLVGGQGALGALGGRLGSLILGGIGDSFAGGRLVDTLRTKGGLKGLASSAGKAGVIGFAAIEIVPKVAERLKDAIDAPKNSSVLNEMAKNLELLLPGFAGVTKTAEDMRAELELLDKSGAKTSKALNQALVGNLRRDFALATDYTRSGVQAILAKYDALPPGVQKSAQKAATAQIDALQRARIISSQEAERAKDQINKSFDLMAENTKKQSEAAERAGTKMGRALGQSADDIWKAFDNAAETTKSAIGDISLRVNRAIDALGGKQISLAAGAAGEATGKGAKGHARGGAFARTGGLVNQPMTFMGEEAPRHPEYVIPTNPAYRGRAQSLLAAAAGAIGLKKGGSFGGSLLEALGPYSIDPFSYDANHAPPNSHWHIAMSTSDAVVAVGKALQKMGFNVSEHPAFGGVGGHSSASSYHYSGRAIDVNSAADETQAETRKVASLLLGLAGGAMGSKAAAAFKELTAPNISGPDGAIKSLVQGASNTVTEAANAYLAQAGAAAGAGAGGRLKGMKGFEGGGSPLAIGQRMAAAVGWKGGQWTALRELWQRESGWNPKARNPSSGAYGIPQSLPANKMASAGSDWLTNPATQIEWGLGYIKDRYGSPSSALDFHDSHNWYAKGGKHGGSQAPLMNVEGDLHMHSDADATKFARELGWRAVIAG